MLINLSNVSYTYENSTAPALAPVTASFANAWTGVVGSNGSGKSTLLKIICGQLTDFSGTLIPPGQFGVYCAQATEHLPALAEDFALDYQPGAIKLRVALGIDDDWIWRYSTLSHGERKRLQIAVALWQNPTVLALDEPTNHVDAATRDTILETLRRFSGVGLLVSHDRELLDALCQQCLFISIKHATMRAGNYTQGRQQEQLEQGTMARQRKTAKVELQHLQAEKTRRAGEAARADSRKSARHLAKGDSDGRAKLGLAIYSGQDGKAGRLSSQMDGRMAAAQERLQEAQVEKQLGGSVWLETQASKRKTLVELDAGSIPLGENRELAYPDLHIGPSSHIGLSGPNGAGKSTLLRRLVELAPSDIQTLYIPQELNTSQIAGLLASLKRLDKDRLGNVLSIVARLNSEPARILDGESLSPGEQRKIMLALGIQSKPQLIIMDEPTNHLDIHSVEALEFLLADCPCALLLVSHDKHFLNTLTTTIWEFTQKDGDSTVAVKL